MNIFFYKSVIAIFIAVFYNSAFSINLGHEIKSNMPFFGELIPPVRRPSIDSVSCRDFEKRLRTVVSKNKLSIKNKRDFATDFAKYFLDIGDVSGASLVFLLPEEFSWQVNNISSVNSLFILIAVHETSHAIDDFLLICGNSGARYIVDRTVFDTGIFRGQTPAVKSLLSNQESLLKELMTTRRHDLYVKRSPSGNDIITLLGEVSAYLNGAHTEFSIYQRTLAGDIVFPTDTKIRDINFSGMIDMLILLKIYLHELDLKDGQTMKNIMGNGQLVCMISAMHASAKELTKKMISHQIQKRLGFSIGLERTKALEFSELIGAGPKTGLSYAQLIERAAKSPQCRRA